MENQISSAKSIRRLLRQSVRALRTSEIAESIRLTDEVINRQPDNSRAHAIKFTAHYKDNDFKGAYEIGDKAAELNPKSQYILNNQACLHLNETKPEQAQELFHILLDEYGENAQWLYNLGLSHSQSNDYEQALKYFSRVVDLDPSYHKAVLQTAAVQTKLGLHEEILNTMSLLRLITHNQPTTNASFINHAVHNSLITKESAEQETILWGEKFIPKSKSYSYDEKSDTNALKIAFNVGAITLLDWSTMVEPVINELAKLGHSINVYWHISGVIANSNAKKISIKNCTKLSDADYARNVHKDSNDVIIDIGGMHSQTRERAFSLQLAKKQYGWLVHTGIYSTDKVTVLDEKLSDHPFAFKSIDNSSKEKVKAKGSKNTITAVGCHAGLTLKVIELWSDVLKKAPKCVLEMDVSSNDIQTQLIKRFAMFGIKEKQLSFYSNASEVTANIVIDNFVQNNIAKMGALFLKGANIVTMKGELFPSQQTANLLEKTGNPEWVCSSKEGYIEIITKLVKSNKPNSKLESQTKTSGITDIEAFAKNFVKQISSGL